MDFPPGTSGIQNRRQFVANSDSDYEDDPGVPGYAPDLDDEQYETDESEVEDPDYDVRPPQWSPQTIGMKDVPFTKEEKFLVPLPNEITPINFFLLLVDVIFLEGIVATTNRYALELFCGPTTTPGSRIHKWKDITVEDLKCFIGLLLHMGILQLPKWKDKRVVSYISTEFENDMVNSINRGGLERLKPLPFYERRGPQKTLRWYKKIFVHVIQMMLVNAHYLYNEVRTSSGENKMPLYDFRLEVIDKLLPDVPEPPRPLKRRRVPHVPSRITEKVACGKRSKQKRCRNVMDSLGCVSHIVLTNSMTNEAYLGEDGWIYGTFSKWRNSALLVFDDLSVPTRVTTTKLVSEY
ncbi:hypothetical protein J6590_032896 [Homalodisca vitripennis]|nr:hypothetical protein J6590_032896 [Homalodisca vitripennis]